MKSISRSFVAAAAVLALGSCDSKVTSVIDRDAPAIQAVENCLPNLYKWVGSLFEIAKAWRLKSGDSNPAGLTVTTQISRSSRTGKATSTKRRNSSPIMLPKAMLKTFSKPSLSPFFITP